MNGLATSEATNGTALALFRSGAEEAAAAAADAESLLGLLERHALEEDGWKRGMSATVALLKHAHELLDRAEETIFRQDRRIAQLEHIATTDELTGLKNRRGFFDAFAAELDRAGRGAGIGGLLIMIDLDNFKAVNDTFGHLAGDACLRLVARALEAEIRLMDTVARLGGDEFVLLLSNTTKKDAAARAQGLAWRLNNLGLAWYGDVIPVRASLGLKAYGRGDSADMIFNAADMQLYGSKRRRREQGQQDSGAARA